MPASSDFLDPGSLTLSRGRVPSTDRSIGRVQPSTPAFPFPGPVEQTTMSLQDAVIAANRFGLGARPGDLDRIAGDARGWLRTQLTPETALPAPLAALPSTAEDEAAFTDWLASLHLNDNAGAALKAYRAGPAAAMTSQGGAAQDGVAMAPDGGKLSIEQSYVRTLLPRYETALQARIAAATTTERPFFERMVHFWSNHFTVSAAKPEAIALPPSFERDVVRTHAMGRFEDMLIASSQHPGMLIYLDNYLSIGPNSFIAGHPEYLPPRLRQRMSGLNENLAREILELHTLGVRSGYTQADVTSFAKILTGWSVKRPRQAGADGKLFRFIDVNHEPGPQTLLGVGYSQAGVDQGEAALRALARHPATADHIATKLARHFVADDPPPAAVAKLSKAFRDSDGDLAALSGALIDLPEAWAPEPAKLKPPEDYLVSGLRAMGGPRLTGRQLTAVLDRMGQKPWFAPGPNGWADVAGEWIGPDPVWKRIEWADAAGKAMATTGLDPAVLAKQTLGPRVSPATLEAIRRAESPAQGLSLLLASAEFQRR
jgi:uncharacterized protein (DUF1800 family)